MRVRLQVPDNGRRVLEPDIAPLRFNRIAGPRDQAQLGDAL
jgi:hypothetical protein